MTDRLTDRLPSLATYRELAVHYGPELGAHYATDEAVDAIVEASAHLADQLGAGDVAFAIITPGDMTRYDIAVARLPGGPGVARRALGADYAVTFTNAHRGCTLNLDGLVHPSYLAQTAGLILLPTGRIMHAALVFAGVLSLLADRLTASDPLRVAYGSNDEYPAYPCPDDPDGLHHVACGCEF